MARRRKSLGNVEASRSEQYAGAGIVESEVKSERGTVPIFDNGGRICMFVSSLSHTHTNTVAMQLYTTKVSRSPGVLSPANAAQGSFVVHSH